MPDSVDFSRKTVLVLGASGFIGSRVAGALAGSPLFRVVAASRRSVHAFDATDIRSVSGLLRDVDCVINCVAGNARTMVQATRVLCEAARSDPPRRIIHLSSMAVYGAATGAVYEDQVPVGALSAYGRAKLACDAIVSKYADDGGDAVILRPTCVFGPGSTQWTTRLVRLLRVRRIGDLGSAGDGRANLAFIDDVVAGIVAAIDAPGVSGRVFNISSSADWSWNEFLVAFGKALGATPIRRVSPRMLRIETKLLAPVRRIAGLAVNSPITEAITPSLAALWRQDIRIDCSAARMALALPQATPEQMIAAALRGAPAMRESAVS